MFLTASLVKNTFVIISVQLQKNEILAPILPSPVVGGYVPLQVKLTVMELDDRETGNADHVDFVHAGDAAFKNSCHEIQDLRWSGSG